MRPFTRESDHREEAYTASRVCAIERFVENVTGHTQAFYRPTDNEHKD
jgi:hypothetical protein